MATVLRNRFSYHRRLFLLLFAFSWALVACFVTFQYSREKRFKAERLDARLQLFNLRLLDALGEGTAPGAFLTGHPLPYGDLRVTVIDDDGRVLFDNSANIRIAIPTPTYTAVFSLFFALKYQNKRDTPSRIKINEPIRRLW
jgi:hypothetical protein